MELLLLLLLGAAPYCSSRHIHVTSPVKEPLQLSCPNQTMYTCDTVQFTFAASQAIPTNQNPWNASSYLWANVSYQSQSSSEDAPATGVGGAFYHNNSEGAVVSIKLTPTAAGTYKISFSGYAFPQGGECSVLVAAGSQDHCGFIQIADNRQYFEVAPTKPFFGIGENLAWVSNAKSINASWEPYLANLSAHGANYVRVWLTDSWDDLYLESEGMGKYSLGAADNIEALLAIAERLDIKVLMCIESFNLFCDKPKPTPCNWNECVYSKQNGGVLDSPAEFFSNDVAQTYFKQRLRYLVARYSSSPAVFAWEFFNEGDITDHWEPASHALWVDEMASYLKSIDPYKHPISTSFCCHDVPEVYNLTSVDFSMTHTYGTWNQSDMADNSQYWEVRMSEEYNKPTYIAEFGTGAKEAQFQSDPNGLALHNGIWASIVSGGAMGAMTWWWDNWVMPFNLYNQYIAPAGFTKSVPWLEYHWTTMETLEPPVCTDVPPDSTYTCAQQKSWGKCDITKNPWMAGKCCKSCFNCSVSCVGPATHQPLQLSSFVRVYGVLGTDSSGEVSAAVIWIQNSNNTWTQQDMTKPADQRAELNQLSNLVGTLPALKAGSYNLTWTNTSTGNMWSESVTCSANPGCKITIPVFSTDIAAYLRIVQ